MSKGTVTKARPDERYDATPYRLMWACPACGHQHPERNCELFDGMRAGIADVSLECEECGATFDVEIDGDVSWTAHTFTFTQTEESPCNAVSVNSLGVPVHGAEPCPIHGSAS